MQNVVEVSGEPSQYCTFVKIRVFDEKGRRHVVDFEAPHVMTVVWKRYCRDDDGNRATVYLPTHLSNIRRYGLDGFQRDFPVTATRYELESVLVFVVRILVYYAVVEELVLAVDVRCDVLAECIYCKLTHTVPPS